MTKLSITYTQSHTLPHDGIPVAAHVEAAGNVYPILQRHDRFSRWFHLGVEPARTGHGLYMEPFQLAGDSQEAETPESRAPAVAGYILAILRERFRRIGRKLSN